jgi:hypothetical protein
VPERDTGQRQIPVVQRASQAEAYRGTITLEGFELDPTFSSNTLSTNASTDVTITKD